MFLFSLVCLPYIGLFPSVARLNFGIEATGGSYKLLYIVWGAGAFLGALAVGTWLSNFDKRRLIPLGMLSFAVFLGVFSVMSSVTYALPVAAALGFVYFMSATAMSSVMQQNLADNERASAMPLWFMVVRRHGPDRQPDRSDRSWTPSAPGGCSGSGPCSPCSWRGGPTSAGSAQDDFLPVEHGGEPFQPVNANRLF